MKRKTLFLLLAFGGLVVIILGSMLTDDSKEVGSNDDYDTSFYVEDSGNLFIKTAKVLDKCCYYVIDIVVSGIGSVFNSILGN